VSLLIPTRAITDASANYPQGYHRGNVGGLPAIEPDLIAANIKWGITEFSILGTMVQWIYDLSFPALAKLVIPPPSLALVVAEDHSGGGHVGVPPALAIPVPSIEATTEGSWILVEDCEDAWDEYVQANVTSTADDTDKKVGTYSAKMDVGVDAAVGRLATEAIAPALDLSPYRYLKAWVKSSVDLASDDMRIMLDDSASCETPLKDLTIPAISSGTWTQVTIDMGDTSGLTAIVSIGAHMVVDKGAFIFRIDQVRATKGQ